MEKHFKINIKNAEAELEFIISNVDAFAFQISDHTIASVKSTNVKNTLCYIHEKVRYAFNVDDDHKGRYLFIKSPKRLCQDGFGGVSSIYLFVACLLKRLNLPFTFVLCKTEGREFYYYVYISVTCPETNEVFPLDILMQKPLHVCDKIVSRKIYQV